MPRFFKIVAIFFVFVFTTEGKSKENKIVLPIEVLLNSENNGKPSTLKGTLLKSQNKAIELKIRSDDGEEGNVDLIIAATKEVQATEQTIDRYSPAFNAELVNKETPQDIKSKVDRNWDPSRQDSSFFYPSQNSEMFPYLTLRQVLQSSQPLILEQNQFSPLQNLRHLEENLQRQVLPHMNQGMGSVHGMPMGVLLSQPIFTRGVYPGLLNQQRFQNAPQVFNNMQQELFHPLNQHNQNLPLGIPQQVPIVQNTPLNRYSLLNATPQNKPPLYRENVLNVNTFSNSPHRPFQRYSESQRDHPQQNQQPQNLQSLPVLLAPNKQPLPLHNRPEYTFDRNQQSINALPQRNLNQQHTILPQHNENQENIPQVLRNGIQNYLPHRDNSHRAPYHPVNTQEQQLYHAQDLGRSQHRPPPAVSSIPLDQNLYRQENVQNSNHNKIHSYEERFKPSITDINSAVLQTNRPTQHHPVQHHPVQPHQSHIQLQTIDSQRPQFHNHQSNVFENPTYRNRILTKLQDGERDMPVYHRSPEEAKLLHSQNTPQLNSVGTSFQNNPHQLTNYPHINSANTGFQNAPEQLTNYPQLNSANVGLRNVPQQLTNYPQLNSPNIGLQNIPQQLTSYPQLNPVSTGLVQPHSNFAPVQSGISQRQVYQEPSYRNPPRNAAIKDGDFSSQADEGDPKRNQYNVEGNYDSSTPQKKRKLKRKKKNQSKNPVDDLEGHSSHQYIIKIG